MPTPSRWPIRPSTRARPSCGAVTDWCAAGGRHPCRCSTGGPEQALASRDLVGLWCRLGLGLHQGRSAISQVERGERLGVAAVEVVVVDDPAVVQPGRGEIDDIDRNRLHEIRLDALRAAERRLDLLRGPLATVVAEK